MITRCTHLDGEAVVQRGRVRFQVEVAAKGLVGVGNVHGIVRVVVDHHLNEQ